MWGVVLGLEEVRPGRSLDRAKGPTLISAANSGGLGVALRPTSEWTDI